MIDKSLPVPITPSTSDQITRTLCTCAQDVHKGIVPFVFGPQFMRDFIITIEIIVIYRDVTLIALIEVGLCLHLFISESELISQ